MSILYNTWFFPNINTCRYRLNLKLRHMFYRILEIISLHTVGIGHFADVLTARIVRNKSNGNSRISKLKFCNWFAPIFVIFETDVWSFCVKQRLYPKQKLPLMYQTQACAKMNDEVIRRSINYHYIIYGAVTEELKCWV